MPAPRTESSELSDTSDQENRDFVRALARGLSVIESFEESQHPLTLSEIATRAGLSRGTVRRSLITLKTLGYLSEDRGRFALTPRILRLGYAHLSSQPVWLLAQPRMAALSKEVNETVSLAVLDDGMIVYLLRITAPRLLHNQVSIGSRLPAYPASMGRVLLAGLSEKDFEHYLRRTELRQLTPFTVIDPERLRRLVKQARDDGFAVNDQEMEVGLRSIAVPIKGVGGITVAALNISASAARISNVEMQSSLLSALRATASQISDQLVHSGIGSMPTRFT